MKCSLKTENTAIFDEVFDTDMFRQFVHFFNNQNFAFRHANNWFKVWRLSDGQIIAGQESTYPKVPFDSPLDWLHHQVINLAKTYLEDICGKEGEEWEQIVYTPYIYPAGTKISWHDDYGYSAACIFYCHTEWSPNWGGELMVAKAPPFNEIVDQAEMDDQIMRKYITKIINHDGFGHYINPLPNRMVFTKGGAWHSINRVDKAAGDNTRNSVVAFFKKA